jgi:hypothetical protein
MYWRNVSKSGLVFSDSKTYMRQMFRNANFHLSQPIYGLGVVGGRIGNLRRRIS